MPIVELYHMVPSDQVRSVLDHGLLQHAQGAKSQSSLIQRTNSLLDEHCPPRLRSRGVGRCANVYAYLASDQGIVDIADGEPKPPSQLVDLAGNQLLRLNVD